MLNSYSKNLTQNVTPREARGLKSLGPCSNAIDYGVAVVPAHQVLMAQDLDSSVAEFILSRAEGLFRNDMGCFEQISKFCATGVDQS